MQIDDLYCYPEGSALNLDGGRVVFLGEGRRKLGYGTLFPGLQLLAVGWLGYRVPSRGPVPDTVIEYLFDAYEGRRILSDGLNGFHTCEVCLSQGKDPCREEVIMPTVKWKNRSLAVYGHGHYLIQYEKKVYRCPALILHYILDHGYQPPLEFMEAIEKGAVVLGKEDLMFRELPRYG